MKNFNDFLFERLQLNNDSKIKNTSQAFKEEDFPIPIRNKNGDKFQWFQWWEYLFDNGPTSKHNLLTEFELSPTSYSTQFASLSKRNIIIPQKGKLVAILPEKWKTK